jgi:8-hydroxy-5-deazaflavin:NADPH oxidoreductase
MTTLATIGAGHIGGAVARAALDAGHDVVVSNSRGPETLAGLVADLAARHTVRGSLRAATAGEAAEAADLVVVAVPLHAIGQVPVGPLAGKVVIDTGNYYPQRDGRIAELDERRATSSDLLQRHLPTSSVVKAFNHIAAAQIVDHRSSAGTEHRRALVVAGDDGSARERVASFIQELGFDVVDLGGLAESWRIEPGTPGYGSVDDAGQLRAHLAAATRD